MSNYTFTPDSCYPLATHNVTLNSERLVITLISTGQAVFDKKYGKGLAIMCQEDSLCVGTLVDNGVFTVKIDFNKPKAAMGFIKEPEANTAWGTDNHDDPGVYSYWNVNRCPIRISSADKVVTVECPCESTGEPCTNSCYRYGEE